MSAEPRPWTGRGAWFREQDYTSIPHLRTVCRDLRLDWAAVKWLDDRFETEFGGWETVEALHEDGLQAVIWGTYSGVEFPGFLAPAWVTEATGGGWDGLIVEFLPEGEISGWAWDLLLGLIAGDEIPIALAPPGVPAANPGAHYGLWSREYGIDLLPRNFLTDDEGPTYPLETLLNSYAMIGVSPERTYPVLRPSRDADYRAFFDQCAARGFPGSAVARGATVDVAAYLAALEPLPEE